MWRLFGGAALIVAGIATIIEVHSHPYQVAVAAFNPRPIEQVRGIQPAPAVPSSGLTPTAHDLLLIAAWALVIFGTLLVAVGLIGYWASQRERV